MSSVDGENLIKIAIHNFERNIKIVRHFSMPPSKIGGNRFPLRTESW